MVFDKTDTKLSSFISQASPEDLSAIASQLFDRIGSLDQREQDRLIDEIQRDPQAKRVLERLQSTQR
jgi:hypothetical protein